MCVGEGDPPPAANPHFKEMTTLEFLGEQVQSGQAPPKQVSLRTIIIIQSARGHTELAHLPT